MMRFALSFGSIHRFRFCVIAATLVATFATVDSARAVSFPDKNLEGAVRALVFDKRGTDTELTDDDLSKVYVLEAKGKTIRDLTGLKCSNIQLIDLSNNEIVNLAPLKDLKHLQSVDLSQNQISDAGPIAGLPGLQYLRLANNRLTAAPDLAAGEHMMTLDLSGNKINDLAPIAKLTRLSSLYLSNNLVTDLGPLAGVTRLSLLSLSDNAVKDVSPLAKQTEIGTLLVDHNKIADLAPLVAAAKADAEGAKRFAPFLRLYLSGNPLCTNAATGEQLKTLSGLGVRVEN